MQANNDIESNGDEFRFALLIGYYHTPITMNKSTAIYSLNKLTN